MRGSRRSTAAALLLVAGLSMIGCIADAPFKTKGPIVPAQLQDGWTVVPPESVGVSRSTLTDIHDRFISENGFYNARSLLIVRDGFLIFEAFAGSEQDRYQFQHIQSITKSVTSIMFGIALSDGLVDSLDQTLYSVIPDKFPSDQVKRTITFRQLLTMTSGIAFDNDDFSLEIHSDKPADPTRYILEKPMYNAPGEEYYYRDCDPHLISAALHRRCGTSLERYTAERLFSPLGIADYYWISDVSGVTSSAHGLHLRGRDMAKLGQLMLDNGRWNGVQIVDSGWVARSTDIQVSTSDAGFDADYGYGFFWWRTPNRRSFSAWGHGGNFIFVNPASRTVAVLMSLPDAGGDVVTSLEEFEVLLSPLLQ